MARTDGTTTVVTATPSRLVAVLPPLLTAALAAGYIVLDLLGGFDHDVPGPLPSLMRGGLVLLQAVALLARHRAPVAVFGVVVLLDLLLLATSAGELGTGAFAVMVAVFELARRGPRRLHYSAIAIGASATALVSLVSGSASTDLTPLDGLLVAVVRVVVEYAAAAAVGEYLRGRERLVDALRERAELVERERIEHAQQELRAGRTALARELHDIAGHHLSGIIVSAQAASALTRSDPERARDTLQSLQDDARTALADLRRTVGLLRHDDRPADGGVDGQTLAPSAAPSIERVATLIEEASARGVSIGYAVDGRVRPLGVLAETAGYRMVQESVANAMRHAPGAVVDVRIDYSTDAVILEVVNGPSADARTAPPGGALGDERFGLAGMEERARLVGGSLTTGPSPDGGWRNVLSLPTTPDVGRRDGGRAGEGGSP